MTRAPVDSPALAGLCVMIVEDDYLLAMDYEAIFRRAGCRVLGPFPREANAAAQLDEIRPDVAILDLNLGGDTPLRLAAKLVENAVPFLIVTGYGLRSLPEPAFRDAPRISKPADPTKLVSAVAALTIRALPHE